jgi:hypothetical protein
MKRDGIGAGYNKNRSTKVLQAVDVIRVGRND